MKEETGNQIQEKPNQRILDFLNGIEASKTIEWTRESEEIERVLKEWGYK